MDGSRFGVAHSLSSGGKWNPGVRESHEVLFIALEGVSVAVIIDALPLMGNFKSHSKAFSQDRDFSGQRFAGPSARPRHRPPFLPMRLHGPRMRYITTSK